MLRILDRASVKLDLKSLGLSDNVATMLHRAAKAPHGIFLVTGPTGSGKTTTLYALLQTFAGSAKKVLSIEDPVEYHFEHVVQTQVAPHLGLTFAAALRSFLRQDPDVILVGEIRDPETAAVAVQAAMTGHFVLASVHANDAFGCPSADAGYGGRAVPDRCWLPRRGSAALGAAALPAVQDVAAAE